MRTIIAALISGLMISACAAGAAEPGSSSNPASSPASSADRETCSVTVPTQPGFVPPEPYPPEPSPGGVWYGAAELWTFLDPNGEVWSDLPIAKDGSVGNKTLWWSEAFSTTMNEDFTGKANITVTAVRLDGSTPTVVEGPGVPSFNPFVGNFMLVGLVLPGPGCWEVTASYRETELSYTMRVER